MFDTDLMEILDAYEDLSVIADVLNNVKSYGVDINLSLAKVDYDDYQCGLHLRIGNQNGKEYEASSKVNGEQVYDVLLTALLEISDEFQKQADAEEELEAKKATTNVIESLKADNMLLERRVEELYKLLEEERKKSNKIKEEYLNQQSNNDFYTLLDKITNKYYNR